MQRLVRWTVGLLWLGAWGALLWAAHRPWEELGGLVGERLRWFERFGLGAGLVAGHTVGELLRDGAGGRATARAVRWSLYPAALAGLACMAALEAAGWEDAAGVALVALLAYGAGASTGVLGLGAYCRGEGPAGPGTE